MHHHVYIIATLLLALILNFQIDAEFTEEETSIELVFVVSYELLSCNL